MNRSSKLSLASLLVAFAVVASLASPTEAFAQAKKPAAKTPMENFKELSYHGWVNNYWGWYFCDSSRTLALANGFSDKQTQNGFLYAMQYALYGYQYGYYGWEYGYSEWILAASDMTLAAYNYEKGMYDYIGKTYYVGANKTKLQPAMDSMYYGYTYLSYADAYYRYAYRAIKK